jgi:hypothetical protein
MEERTRTVPPLESFVSSPTISRKFVGSFDSCLHLHVSRYCVRNRLHVIVIVIVVLVVWILALSLIKTKSISGCDSLGV